MAAPTISERFVLREGPAQPRTNFADDVRGGLTARPKQLQPHYFYDALGSALFAAICELPEYYVTRAETEILLGHAQEIAAAANAPARIIELGSGNGRKTRLLLDAILSRQPSVLYQPVDVDGAMLQSSARDLLTTFPTLSIEALCGEYRDVAALGPSSGRTLTVFLGSSIGNLGGAAATELLRELRRLMKPRDAALIGFDLVKDKATLEAAYDDSLGVTAAFNLNLLARINRELGGHFDLEQFAHKAHYNESERRIEMRLVSSRAQTVRIDSLGVTTSFAKGETIHTENSYKYDLEQVARLAAPAGLIVERHWTDARGWFADVLLRAE